MGCARPLGCQYHLLLIAVVDTRVLLYAKMLKETENEETRLFCQIFVIGGILIEEGWATWAPLAMPMKRGYAITIVSSVLNIQ